MRRGQEIVSIWHSAVWQNLLCATHHSLPQSLLVWFSFSHIEFEKLSLPYFSTPCPLVLALPCPLHHCVSLPPSTFVCLSHRCFCCLGLSMSLSTSLNICDVSPTAAVVGFTVSSPCLSHPPPPMFPSGDPLSIHHYFHGYLAGFTVRPGSLESREVIECLYACREGLDYSDFDSLGKGMKVCPPAQLAWVSSTLLLSLVSQNLACSPTFLLCVFLSLDSWICQRTLSIVFSPCCRFM